MTRRCRIAVIGTFTRDQIVPPTGGETVESIGGLYYTVAALAHMPGLSAEIFPISRLGEDIWDQVTGRLSRLPGVRLDAIHRHSMPNTRVNLIYRNVQVRDEITTQPMHALGFREVALAIEMDMTIVNLITGEDIKLGALQTLTERAGGPVYLDFHTLALGMDSEGKRYYRRPEKWEAWVASSHLLQLNANEAATLATGSPRIGDATLARFAREALTLGPQVCNVTLGPRGSLVAYKSDGDIITHWIDAYPADEVVDVTGCGDAFAAGFVAGHLLGWGPLESAHFANKVAGLNCTVLGTERIGEISQTLQEDVAES
ncbi:MAG: carbohydrate kinase family protein [Fidelibacterota bacterium]